MKNKSFVVFSTSEAEDNFNEIPFVFNTCKSCVKEEEKEGKRRLLNIYIYIEISFGLYFARL